MPYRSLIMSLLDEPSHFKLTVNSVDFTVPNGSIDLDIEIMETLPDIGNMYLRMSLQEDHVTFGADTHHDVTHDMLTDTPLTVSTLGQVQNVVMPFTVSAGWNQAELEIVAFIQDDDDKKVHASVSSRPAPDYSLRFYALGDRQVVGPGVGEYNYDNFRVYNLGTSADNFTVDVSGDIPAGWIVGVCDDMICYGTTYSQVLAPGDYMDLHIMVTPNSPGYCALTVEMSQDNLAHEFPRTLGYRYFTDDLDVLFVDDDGGEPYEDYFTDAIGYNNYTYGVWDRLASAPTAAALGNFPIVIWATALSFPTLDADDRAALGAFMDAGGSLFATGQDIGWDLYDQGQAAWYQTYLHATFVADDTNHYDLEYVPGEITEGIDLRIVGGDGASNQQYPSDIDPLAPYGNVIWEYDANRNAAVRADNGTYRVVYCAFGFEAIDNEGDRRDAMSRILDWLNYDLQIDVEPSTVMPGAFLTSAPNPATARATMQFNLPVAGETSLQVFTTDGRLVGSLVDGPMEAGPHSVVWNFTDARGNALPAGVYFYRLQGEGVDMKRKLLLVK